MKNYKVISILSVSAMIFIIAILLTSFTSCTGGLSEEVRYRKVIPSEKAEQAAEWIRSVVEAAYKEGHNGGDLDDPEDVVNYAKWTAKELFGEVTIGILVSNAISGYVEFIPYNECSPRQKKMCDDYKAGH